MACQVDLERIMRINGTLSPLTPEQRRQTPLRPVNLLAITPSVPLDSLASRHVGSLPLPIKALLSAIGATERRGGALASYLLFEGSYTRSLIELGRVDTLSRRDDVLQFFDIDTTTKVVSKRKYTEEILHNYKNLPTHIA